MPTAIEIAQATHPRRIGAVARAAGIPKDAIFPYSRYVAKVDPLKIPGESRAKLILVAAINPTPAGEGNTTVSVGLADGMTALGKKAMLALCEPSFTYEDSLSLADKIRAVASRIYGPKDVTFAGSTLRQLANLEAEGWGSAPVCIAKTQYSFSGDPKALGVPEGFTLSIRPVRLNAGAGFIVAFAGDIIAMPACPRCSRQRASKWTITARSPVFSDHSHQNLFYCEGVFYILALASGVCRCYNAIWVILPVSSRTLRRSTL